MSRQYKGETTRSASRIHDMRLQRFIKDNCPCTPECVGRHGGCQITCERGIEFRGKLEVFRGELDKIKKSTIAHLEVRFDKENKEDNKW